MRQIPFPHGGLINIPLVPNVYTKKEQEALDNAPFIADILAQLEANDKKIVRALAEGDTDRISAHMVKQSELRAQLGNPKLAQQAALLSSQDDSQ